MTGRGFIDWAFRSRETDKITIAQLPNVPLALFIATAATQAIAHPRGTAGDVVQWTGFVSLVWFAGWEVTSGVNPFRRLLGATVLALAVL